MKQTAQADEPNRRISSGDELLAAMEKANGSKGQLAGGRIVRPPGIRWFHRATAENHSTNFVGPWTTKNVGQRGRDEKRTA